MTFRVAALLFLAAMRSFAADALQGPFVVCVTIKSNVTGGSWDIAFRKQVALGQWTFAEGSISFVESSQCPTNAENLPVTMTVNSSSGRDYTYNLTVSGVPCADTISPSNAVGSSEVSRVLNALSGEVKKCVESAKARVYQELVTKWAKVIAIPGCPQPVLSGQSCAALIERDYARFYVLAGNNFDLRITLGIEPQQLKAQVVPGICVKEKLVLRYINPPTTVINQLNTRQTYSFDSMQPPPAGFISSNAKTCENSSLPQASSKFTPK